MKTIVAIRKASQRRGTEEVSQEGLAATKMTPRNLLRPLPPHDRSPALRFRRQRRGGRSAGRCGPDVYNHNTETVPRLFSDVVSRPAERTRPYFRCWTLEMFRRIRRRNPAIALKTGLMLGLGETTEELLDTLADLFDAGCRLLTLGQYLRPSPRQMPVVDSFCPRSSSISANWPGESASSVAAGPFVRSSYHAREMAMGIMNDE